MSAYPSTTTALEAAATIVNRSQGASIPFNIEREFDLDTLISGKLADADIVNLFTLPAKHTILSTAIETTRIAVGCTGTCTLKLRFTTTDIGATCDILTTARAVGGNATVALPLDVGSSAVLVNLVAAIGGGTTTANPKVKVRMLVCDMG